MSVETTHDLYEDEYPPGPWGRPRRNWPLIALALGLVVLLVAGIGALWVNNRINPPGAPGVPVQIVVSSGMSTADVADLLERQDVIASATVFSWYARFKGAGSIKAGTYSIRRGEDLGTVLRVLEEGAKPSSDRITIPEGLTVNDVAERVGRLPGRSAPRFLEVAESGSVRSPVQPPGSTNLEGVLFPETYFVEAKDDEAGILARMVGAFDQAANELDIRGAAARLGITPYEAVVVASMIEREAKVDEDRGPIAQVIYNRLDKGMPLQIDATVLYSLGRSSGRVLNRDLEADSPYNTYKVEGLPPAPIASPGRKSLEAALNPTPGPWLWYVLADANGKHAFASTDQEFARFRAQAQAKGLL